MRPSDLFRFLGRFAFCHHPSFFSEPDHTQLKGRLVIGFLKQVQAGIHHGGVKRGVSAGLYGF